MYSQNYKPSPKKVKINGFNLAQRLYISGAAKQFELNPTQMLVLIGLASHYNPEKSVVFPSQEYLAKNLNISERSVVRAINELIKKRLIVKSKNGNNNLYAFTAIFFGAVDMAPESCQSDTLLGVKMSDKQYNSNYKNNSSDFRKNKKAEKESTISNIEEHIKRKGAFEQKTRIAQTKTYIEQQKKVEIGSPLDFDKQQAIDYIENLGTFAQSSYFAKKLKEKWNL
ncbi:MAG: helix-turn-helix domain-containing protein [bacterium]